VPDQATRPSPRRNCLVSGVRCQAQPRRGDLVGAENSVTSCDLHVLVDEATEPVSSDRPNGCPGTWGSAARGRALMQRPVRSVRVVVLYVFTQHDVEVTWSGDEEMVEAFAA
jgi:hypothetical protein